MHPHYLKIRSFRRTGKKTRLLSPSRQAAFDVLTAVHAGGYASDLLRSHTAALAGRDAALAGQIVYGVLRFQSQLDHLIRHYSGRPVAQLDDAVVLALRTALFQLRYLERIPAHAAVHETVEWIKRQRRAASGLVNAVLRKVNRHSIPFPDLATELSCPAWLLARWEQHFGAETAVALARAALQQPLEYVRVPPGNPPPPGLTLAETNVDGAFRIVEGERPPGLRLHDISSQAIVPLLGLAPNHRYLDLCAAPGNKTRQALEKGPRLAVACDLSWPRLETVGAICPRVQLDATGPLPFRPGSFDRIFIDAPCSGTGTIGRNPEIKWRVQNHDFAAFGKRQIEMVEQALPLLAPGGKLLYATCSLEREENEEVIAAVQRAHPAVVCERDLWRLPGRDPGDGFYAALLSLRTSPEP